MSAPNRNIFWAKTFVDELVRCGVQHVCIAPGSRSTPLVIAFVENPDVTVHSLIDERSAAFFALGVGLATGSPAALVCSSGTATANFYPAVIEAHYSNVPLLVLTADRPPELRFSGANQTIDQVKMYGDHVLWSVDVALPESSSGEMTIRSLRTLACRAFDTAVSLPRGPVHLNFPYRKPLEPTPVSSDNTDVKTPRMGQVFTRFAHGKTAPTAQQIDALTQLISESPRGLIMCGSRMPSGDTYPALADFAQATGYPVLADAISGARFNTHITSLSGYDTFMASPHFPAPDIVIHIGAMPTSGVVERYFNTVTPAYRVLITENGVWTDPHHSLSHVVVADCPTLLRETAAHIRRISEKPPVDLLWQAQINAAEQAVHEVFSQQLMNELFDASALAAVADALPDESRLFVASSLPVRHLEQFAAPRRISVDVFSNRGASGIDGTISSAFGVAVADRTRPNVLIIGDLAFYHDMNGLLAAKRSRINNLTIVLINNDGGGIFHRLPIAQFDPPFTELFLTPHGLDFEPAVRMYGLDYQRVDSISSLQTALKQSIKSGRANVIEVRTNSHHDFELRDAINKAAIARVNAVFSSPEENRN